jgi:hypothetical protein
MEELRGGIHGTLFAACDSHSSLPVLAGDDLAGLGSVLRAIGSTVSGPHTLFFLSRHPRDGRLQAGLETEMRGRGVRRTVCDGRTTVTGLLGHCGRELVTVLVKPRF